MVEHLKDDLALQLFALKQRLIRDLDRKPIGGLAAHLDCSVDWSRESVLPSQAGELLDRSQFANTITGRCQPLHRHDPMLATRF